MWSYLTRATPLNQQFNSASYPVEKSCVLWPA